jgi:hypothetical protein
MYPAVGARMLVLESNLAGSTLLASPRKAGLTMTPFSTLSSSAVPTWPPEVWSALQRLRSRYQQDTDLWTERELTRLRFMRWLAQTGRLFEDGAPRARTAETFSR